ncbi:SDR family NAD(P)-dependent oxidoreductase [Microbacterium lacticum]
MSAPKPAVQGRYEGRTVAITGAAQGLGLAMATRFAAEGATLALVDVNDACLTEAAEAVRKEHGATVLATTVDVTDSGQVAGWIGAVEAATGSVDVLVNNAGIIRDNRVENITDEDWDAVIDVSLKGAFLCARAVLPGMRCRRYGRIISFSSMSWRGNFGQANYPRFFIGCLIVVVRRRCRGRGVDSGMRVRQWPRRAAVAGLRSSGL